MLTQSKTIADVYVKLDAMNALVANINPKLDKLNSIDDRLQKLECSVQNHLARLVAAEESIVDFEKSLQYMSDIMVKKYIVREHCDLAYIRFIVYITSFAYSAGHMTPGSHLCYLNALHAAYGRLSIWQKQREMVSCALGSI